MSTNSLIIRCGWIWKKIENKTNFSNSQCESYSLTSILWGGFTVAFYFETFVSSLLLSHVLKVGKHLILEFSISAVNSSSVWTLPIPSLIPRPSPKSGKRVWCSEWHFLSHEAGPYFVRSVIIVFLNPEVEFLTPQSIWTTIQPSLQKLEMATMSIGTAENRLRDKFSLFPIRFEIQSLTSCNYN